MGYSERMCQICGVSFNVGRIRTRDEPRSHGWHRFRHEGNYLFVDGGRNSHIGECGRDAGCMLAFRDDVAGEFETEQRDRDGIIIEAKGGNERLFDHLEDENDGTDENDEDFVPDPVIMRKLRTDDEAIVRSDASSLPGPTASTQSASVSTESVPSVSTTTHHAEYDDGDVFGIDRMNNMEYDTPTETCSQNDYEDWHSHIGMTSDSDDDAVARYCEFLNDLRHEDRPRAIRDEEEVALPLYRPLVSREEDTASIEGSDASFECDEEKDSHEWKARRLDHRISGKLSHYSHPLSKGLSPRCRDSIWEHIAGPGCVNTNGYNGTRISQEEMQFANTLQCLVPKVDEIFDHERGPTVTDWQSEWDDEPWERMSQWFLSGISDHMPSRDCDDPEVVPPRHGWERPNAENIRWIPRADDSVRYAMPFHPSCFEIYKRAAIQRHGRFDVNLLGRWWKLKNPDFHHFPRSEAVKNGYRQWWRHNLGDEYLAADPLWPSGLKEAILSAGLGETRSNKQISSRWVYLPLEVIVGVLDHLDLVSIANSSLAIPETRSMAKKLMQRRLRLQYPHLWELGSTQPYYKWTGLTANELKTRQRELDQKESEFQLVYKILEEDNHDYARDHLKRHWDQGNEARRDVIFSPAITEKSPLTVPTDEIGIAKFVLALHEAQEVGNLKGLRNRDRIWKDCETILNQIEELEDQGEIQPNGQSRPEA